MAFLSKAKLALHFAPPYLTPRSGRRDNRRIRNYLTAITPDRRAADQFTLDAEGGKMDAANVPFLGTEGCPRRTVRVWTRLVERIGTQRDGVAAQLGTAFDFDRLEAAY
jgi:hypothetical protein